jgi:hypothetical protein
MREWYQFYAVIGGASATLLGLLFVVISMNVKATLGRGRGGSNRLAEQAFQNYLAVLMVALVALFPDTSLVTFGRVTLCVTAVWFIWMLVRLYQAAVQPGERESKFYALRRHLSSLIGFTILVTTALRMALRFGADLHWFASATIVLLFSATTVSWEFLVKIANPDPA